ncbi:MAG: sulfotransferase [Anaerolineae bacterium]|nr:sulfotransferase [Anaerolineae bacterium]
MSLVTIIGRGHSGTRAISHTLYASGVYMGRTINNSGDLVPPDAMYDACRVIAQYVTCDEKTLRWDFSALQTMDAPPEYEALIDTYLASVLNNNSEHKGWKIPETTLVYPWITRRFPEAKYIFWIRNPRDCILGRHVTDDLSTFGIPYPKTDDERLRRAISWKYQYDLVKATPKPAHWLEVRFEDFVLKQEETLQKLEDFLGYKLARIIVRPDAIDRWKQDDSVNYFDFFEPAMRKYGYAIPE